MTRDEFANICKALIAYYPNAQKLFSRKDVMEAWYQMLADIDYPLASAAVKIVVAEQAFTPTIADIRSACRRVLNGSKAYLIAQLQQDCTKCITTGQAYDAYVNQAISMQSAKQTVNALAYLPQRTEHHIGSADRTPMAV